MMIESESNSEDSGEGRGARTTPAADRFLLHSHTLTHADCSHQEEGEDTVSETEREKTSVTPAAAAAVVLPRSVQNTAATVAAAVLLLQTKAVLLLLLFLLLLTTNFSLLLLFH